MFRTTLMLGLSVVALAAAAQAKNPPVTINGGGAASQQFNYSAPDVNGQPVSELSLYNSQQSAVSFGTYWSTPSGTAQAAMITDDLTCLINKVTGNNGGNCSGTPGGAFTTHYGVSESVLSATQLSSWATSTVGQSVAGDFIQIPALGTGLAIITNDVGVTQNGQVALTDNDLCGIFSGQITNFSQITDGPTVPPAGAFQLVYRSDSAGTTFYLTNHLSAVCNSSNTAPGVTFTATSTFSSLFGVPITNQIPNAVGVSGLAAMANYLAGLSASGAVPYAISYLSPDWTSIDSATSQAKLSNGQPSPLLVAGLNNNGKYFLPTTTAIETALTHVSQGQNTEPPSTAQQGANAMLWVPIVQIASTGYPIVGYSSIELTQCYANKTIGSKINKFMKVHYSNAKYTTIQSNNGLVSVANSGAAKTLGAIKANILANKNGWDVNIDNGTACAGLPGR